MILVIGATAHELRSAERYIADNNLSSQVKTAITGVGIARTTYHLTTLIASLRPWCVVQVGIAGALDTNLALGDVVAVTSEQWCDLGAEANDSLVTVFDLGFDDHNAPPYIDGIIPLKGYDIYSPPGIKKVTATTSDTAHGNERSIAAVQARTGAQVESMEGAAAAFVCALEMTPLFEIRAISNYVEKRDTSRWNIPLAFRNLDGHVTTLLGELVTLQARSCKGSTGRVGDQLPSSCENSCQCH